MSPFDAEIVRVAVPFLTDDCHCDTANDNATLIGNDATPHSSNTEVVGSNVELNSAEVFIRHFELLRMFNVVVCAFTFGPFPCLLQCSDAVLNLRAAELLPNRTSEFVSTS